MKFGQSLLVTAAFIGPGTIATASKAGGEFGFVLLWALLFSIVATLVLQEMAARLGLVTGSGLSEALRESFTNPWLRTLSVVLVASAIGIGNAAYQTGNISGAALGITSVLDIGHQNAVIIISTLAFILLASGQQRVIEVALIALVAIMSSVFLLTMVWIQPDLSSLLNGLFIPSIPDGSELLIIALIGTTVVPYNLFLQASSVSQNISPELANSSSPEETKKQLSQQLFKLRIDSGISISLGGLVTLAIVSTAATAFFNQPQFVTPASMAIQLEPLLGGAAKYCFALGIFSAGITSAVTAPLAAAYALSGAFAWPISMNSIRFKAIWLSVLVSGFIFSLSGIKPLAAIIFAQAANGLLLPVIAIFLLIAMNQKRVLGDFRNHWFSNLMGILVVATVSLLGCFKLYSLF